MVPIVGFGGATAQRLLVVLAMSILLSGAQPVSQQQWPPAPFVPDGGWRCSSGADNNACPACAHDYLNSDQGCPNSTAAAVNGSFPVVSFSGEHIIFRGVHLP